MKKLIMTTNPSTGQIEYKQILNFDLEIDFPLIILGVFPVSESGKNTYYNNVLGYITATLVQTRLHIDATKFTTFKDLIGNPPSPTGTPPNTNSTAGTWNFVYPQAISEALTTKPLRTAKNNLINDIEDALNDLYSDIPDSVLNETDILNLRIKPKSDRATPDRDPEKITAMVVVGLSAVGGGNVWVTCRTSSDSKRASKINQKANIEYAYSLVAPGDVPPATAADCQVKVVVTKAKYLLELGEAAAGKKLYLFARWVYTKHKTKSGNFGTSVSTIVS